MLQEIRDLQTSSVLQLVSKIKKQEEVTFKAPTGSGKTYMMADLMNQILVDNSTVFLVSTLSKAGLGKQNFEKFVEYELQFPNLNPFLINSEASPEETVYIPDDYNVYVLPRDLYKEKSRIKDSGAMFNFLFQMKFLGKQIYLIKDECHIATNNLDDLNDYFAKVINFSATPKFSPDVEITIEKAVEVKLIKRIAEKVSSKQHKELDNRFQVNEDADVEEAVNKFIDVKKDYINKLKVNPCLIVQISNKDKAEEEWAKIKKIVDDPAKNLKWMYIVDDVTGKGSDTNDDVKKLPVSKWKDYVKNNESLVDIIIFKMVITEGWDIPRACMLYQVRDSKSKQMDEQVIGRVRRNPILLNWEEFDEEAHELALTCWVWGIIDGSLMKFKKVTIQPKRNFEVFTTKLNSIAKKDGFDLVNFLKQKDVRTNTESIFDLQRKWNRISQETSDLCWANIKDYNDWMNLSFWVDEIDRENTAFMAEYDKSMELDETQKFADSSYFELSNMSTMIYEIDDWVWKLNDSEDEEYHFDSEAEKEFAKILKKFKTIYWGKNYYPNSKIKFEYVLYEKHNSFPDFILKDKNNEVHIFEVKSLDKGYQPGLDEKEYQKKVTELRKMFLYASKVTNQYFYLPIRNLGSWAIYKLEKGIEEVLSEDQFKSFMKERL